ncbi:MAG: FAD binding domain-containing protein [Ignavibacteriales bacterium]|nr:FAD binding domain-containing protein [Ignavibacteriales bacterium]
MQIQAPVLMRYFSPEVPILWYKKQRSCPKKNIVTFHGREDMKGIRPEGGKCIIGAAATASEIAQSPVMKELLPDILSYFRLISSEPIRNMGTIAGNITNASPVRRSYNYLSCTGCGCNFKREFR